MATDNTAYRFPDEEDTTVSDADNSSNPLSAAAGDEVEVDIVDATPEEDRDREPMKDPPKDITDEELEKYDESVRTRIRKFARGYHDERRRAEGAEREKQAAIEAAAILSNRNKELEGTLNKSQTALLAQAKHVVQAELEKARGQFRVAHESGDAEAVLKAQEALNTAQVRAEKVNNFKPPVAKASADGVQPDPQRPPAAPSAPAQRDERALAWQQKNSWFGENRRMTAYALAVHSELVEQGINPTSDEYYQKVDGEMRRQFTELRRERTDAASSARRPSVVAPATRTGPASQRVTLTKDQVAMAKRLNVTLQDYAKQVIALNRKS